MRKCILWVAMAVVTGGCSWSRPNADPELGRLIVFVQPGGSSLDLDFHRNHLPAIRRTANGLGVPLVTRNAARGAPAELTVTPALVYQNHRGRSIYYGRYTTLGRVRTFLRTARFAPQAGDTLRRVRTPVWRIGRATIAAPLKIAPPTGQVPEDLDASVFAAGARRAVLDGFRRFEPAETVALRGSDRSFYMDFYPWISEDDELFLSVALFSQFHCKQPIYTHGDEPFVGPWSQRERLFREAATALENAVVAQMAESANGDGFDPIPATVPQTTWEALGLELPPPPAKARRSVAGKPLARDWRVGALQPDAPSRIRFRFAPPLDTMSGEVRDVRGQLQFAADLAFTSMRGWFDAGAASLTMGEPDLDKALHSETYLDVKTFPRVRFDLTATASDRSRLAYGEPATVTMTGTFTLRGVVVPLTVRAILEPAVDESGEPRVLMQAAFQLRLAPFEMEGPDPSQMPANDLLLFDVTLVLEPVAANAQKADPQP